MGEVYRAHDSTLGRDVALKILPATFAGDVERRGRFEREAKTLAALMQLLIVNLDQAQILLADVSTTPKFSSGVPRVVGQLPKGVVALAVTADLQRILALVSEATVGGPSVTVVQNWTAAIERR